MDKNKILITGTDGFIGRVLKSQFQEAGYKVYGTVFDIREPEDDNEVKLDITNRENFHKLGKAWGNDIEFDVIIHSIGIVDQTIPESIMEKVHVYGTKLMCDWAKAHGCKHFIQLSSIAVYGIRSFGENNTEANAKRRTTKNPLFAPLPYGRTKAKAEVVIEDSGIPFSNLRLPPVLGKNDSYITPAILEILINGIFFKCSDKDKKLSILYVKNLGPIISKLIEIGPINSSLNCGSHDITWQIFTREYANLLGKDYNPKKRSILSILIHFKNKKYLLIAIFSRFGGHFPSDELHKRLENFNMPYQWQDGVNDAVEDYFEKQK